MRTILAARRKTTIKDMITLARKYPDRITAAVRTKGGAYRYKPVGADGLITKPFTLETLKQQISQLGAMHAVA